jgi:hypothetical protein
MNLLNILKISWLPSEMFAPPEHRYVYEVFSPEVFNDFRDYQFLHEYFDRPECGNGRLRG